MIPFLICTIAVLIVATTIFIILNARKNKQINNLKENIESFIEGGEKAEYSTADSNFARLQNAVAELENLLLLEKSNSAKQTFNIEDVSTVFRSFSKMQGMKYFSTTRKKEKILYEKAYTIANETSSEKISDKNTGNADGQVLFCYQEDASFGVCRYKVEYKQNQDTLFALFSNIDTLGIGPFKAIFPGKMKINTIVIDCGDSILLYLGTDADSKKLPGIKGQLEDSFSSITKPLMSVTS